MGKVFKKPPTRYFFHFIFTLKEFLLLLLCIWWLSNNKTHISIWIKILNLFYQVSIKILKNHQSVVWLKNWMSFVLILIWYREIIKIYISLYYNFDFVNMSSSSMDYYYAYKMGLPFGLIAVGLMYDIFIFWLILFIYGKALTCHFQYGFHF